jgi:hypothetical protein
MTDQYVPGTCNIGSEEIALRRRAGHIGLAVTAALATALLRSDLHPAWRLTLALPAAGAAEQHVADDQAEAADRRRSLRISAASGAIGLGVALAAMLVARGGSLPATARRS